MVKVQMYKAIIIGAGNIGAFYDKPNSERILTHGHGLSKSDKFDLIGFVDSDEEKGLLAAKRWNTNFFKNIDEAFEFDSNIKIVVIAVPDKYHYEVLKQISTKNIKAVIVEKPITQKIEEAIEIIELYKAKKIELIVNYTRRFIPEIEKIQIDIKSKTYGKYLNAIGYYGKGILHNGSHMIDLINYFFDGVKDYAILDKSFDYYEDDPSVSAILTLNNNQKLILQKLDCKISTIFELDLFFEKARIRISELGYKIEYFEAQKSPYFEGYTNYVQTKEIKTSLDNAILNILEHTYEVLEKNKTIKCSSEDAYKAMKICIALKEG